MKSKKFMSNIKKYFFLFSCFFISHCNAVEYDRSNWMYCLQPIIGNLNITDFNLPGTHDSLTFDLSETIADDANDLSPFWAKFLHDLKDFDGLGKFIKKQAQTQTLNLTSQLDQGIRFLDFRITYSSAPKKNSSSTHYWYGVHLVQTNQQIFVYLKQINQWLLAHPTEIVVLWISRHGNACNTVYPNVPIDVLEELWTQIESIFGNRMYRINDNLIYNDLIKNGKQIIFYVSDYKNITNGHDNAIPGCLIDNQLGDHINNESYTQKYLQHTFEESRSRRKTDIDLGKLYLLSMAASAPSDQEWTTAFLEYQPFFKKALTKDCTDSFNLPGMTWCPPTLLEISKLTNYYNQISFSFALKNNLVLKNYVLQGVLV